METHLQTLLSTCTVRGGDPPYVDFGSRLTFDALKSLEGAILEKKSQWLRDRDVWSIVFGTFFAHLKGVNLADGERKPLSELLPEPRIAALAEEVARKFDAIPRDYMVYIPVPRLGHFGCDELELTKTLALIHVSSEANYNSLRGGPRSLGEVITQSLGDWQSHFPEGWSYLRVRVRGYFDGSHDESAAENALSVMKQLLIFGEATSVFERQRHWLGGTSVQTAVCHAVGSDQIDQFRLPGRWARQLESYAIAKSVFTRPRGLLAFAASSDDSTTENVPVGEQPARLRYMLTNCLAAIEGTSDPGLTGNLRTAAEWAFDANAEDNETASFLHLSIGFEALLDSPKEEATKRLADRLAYLLGRSQKDRNVIRERYERFYGCRNRVVHGREKRLNKEARELLRWAEDTLRLAIGRELMLLSR